MARAPMLTTPFSNPQLLELVLSDPTFAKRGYLWGYDGSVHYCFMNPNKVRVEIWKKRFHLTSLLFLVLGGLFGTFILYKHYAETAKEQAAAAVSNGPMMRLPGDVQFDTVFWILVALLGLPIIAGILIGIWVPVVGWAFGAFFGAVAGLNLVALALFILGQMSKPFGAVVSPIGIGEPAAVPPGRPYHFGRGPTTAFSSYRIGPGDPAGLTWGCGGMTAMIVNRRSAGSITGPIGTAYDQVILRQIPMIVWGLIDWSGLVTTSAITGNPDEEGAARLNHILQAIATQITNYDNEAPPGLLIVAGSRLWTRAHTLAMINHCTRDAAATDGSQSALLGSGSELVIPEGLYHNITSYYMDPLGRYGIKAVPE